MADRRTYTPLGGTRTRGLSVTAQISTPSWMTRLHDNKGQFQTGVANALAAAHLEMARRVQELAADELDRQRSPRQRRTQDLLTAAILDANNREVSAQGWAVGSAQWLFKDSPAHRYARRIEFGGPNPMSLPQVGGVRAFFYSPGGPTPFGAGSGQGRVGWFRPGSPTSRAGYHFKAQDAASDGYRLHTKAGDRFFTAQGRLQVLLYEKAFDEAGLGIGLRRIKLRRA